MFFDILKAEYDSGYKIKLVFEDGSYGTVDLQNYIRPDTVFKDFDDLNFFRNFKIEYGTLVWGEGEVDIAPERLYERATGKKVIYPSQKNVV